MEQFDYKNLPEYDGHALVKSIVDDSIGLQAIIAIHNTNLGPATGGTRYWVYENPVLALQDALRLSKAMTYKCALAGVSYGGGKGIIMAPSNTSNRLELMKGYAKGVNSLGGVFTTGEDVGITEEDLLVMQEESPYINGRAGKGGALAPWAALGVFSAIKAGVESIYGSPQLKGKTVAIKGVGKVGGELCRLLLSEGANIVVADINKKAIASLQERFGKLSVIESSLIHRLPVDIFAPCALSGDLSLETAVELQCKLVCGAANNQISHKGAVDIMHNRGIVYVPDYVANAGGLINVAAEMSPDGYLVEKVTKHVSKIYTTTRHILEEAKSQKLMTIDVANIMAERMFKKQYEPTII